MSDDGHARFTDGKRSCCTTAPGGDISYAMILKAGCRALLLVRTVDDNFHTVVACCAAAKLQN